jgi:hypothetical protein
MPQTQLTELQVGICGTEACLGALTWSPNLVTLGVTLEARSQVRPMVQLPKLIQLEILAYEDPGYLFDHLTLPAFRDFKCEYGSTSVLVWSHGQFVSLLT